MIPSTARCHLSFWIWIPILAAGLGCKTPCAWPFRSFHTVPRSADPTATEYWDSCGSDAAIRGGTRTGAALVPEPDVEDRHVVEGPVVPAGHQQSSDQGPLRLPQELPGAGTEPLVIPNMRELDPSQQRDTIRQLFPELRPTETAENLMPQGESQPLGLEMLHQLAHANHPSLRAASAAVESARGQMIQAGLPPNPRTGYEADTVNTVFTKGYQGAFLSQTIITARKLGLATEAAAIDYANAVIAQRKTWVQVTSNIRRSYFQLLAARERVRLATALYDLASRAYRAQVELVAAGEAAPYEPLQLRVLTTQARASLVRAQQDAIAAWRSLAAAVGVPDLDVAMIEGRIDCPVPSITYEDALKRLQAVHTDIQIAENSVRKQQTLVTLADRTPIPNLDVGFVLQRDYTFSPGTTTYNLVLGGEVPVLNQNQGNRISARAELVKSGQQVTEVQLSLIAKLAQTYGVYRANRELADSFKTDGLSDQVRAYRGVYQRYLADPNGVSFNDVIVAQQTLASVLTQYLDILQSQWQSVVDLGELLQVEDLFQMGTLTPVAEIPSLE